MLESLKSRPITTLPDDHPVRGAHPLPHRRSRPRPQPARGQGPGLDAGDRAAGRHLDRRDHPGLHLLLLRRDAGRLSLPGPQVRRGVPDHARGRPGGRVRGVGERQAAGQGLEPGAVALRRADGRHPAGDRREHRADLPRELPEPGRVHEHRLLAARTGCAAARRSRCRSSPDGEGGITRGIIEHGGLFQYNVARLQGKVRGAGCRHADSGR